MIVEPYKLRPAPPILALLDEDGAFLDEGGGGTAPERSAKGVQVWASAERVQQLTRAGRGRMLCWRGQPIRYEPPRSPHGFHVRVLAIPFPADEDALAGLAAWRDWLAGYGAAPAGSLGGTSMSLLRASIDEPLWTSVPFASCPPIRYTIGGRQELGPAGAPVEIRGRLRHFDMQAAYPRTLGALEYGGHWLDLHEDKLERHAALFSQAGMMVFARARVRLAGVSPGPLVRRPRSEPESAFGFWPEYPAAGVIQGVWTYAELEAAREQGAKVTLLQGWVHASGGRRPFERWLKRVEHGRTMEGFAAMLGKATGSALWGQFAISRHGRRQLLYYDRRGRRQLVDLPARSSRRPAHDLSEYLTGSVRAELHRFLVAAGDRLVCAHTDGGWVDCSTEWRYLDWRTKEQASRLRLLDPQVYAYTEPGGAERYVVSGWPADAAPEWFESQWAAQAVAA